MQKIESRKDLENWDSYVAYLRDALKLVDDGSPAFISKKKIDFDTGKGVWKGYAFLAGRKAIIAVQKLKSDGVLFVEGLCDREGKDLLFTGFAKPELVKGARKTAVRLKLGYKIHAPDLPGADEDDTSDADSDEEPSATEERGRDAFAKLKKRMTVLIRDSLRSDSPVKTLVAGLLREALAFEKSGDWLAATQRYEQIDGAIASAASKEAWREPAAADAKKLTPERRKAIVDDLGKMDKNIDRLLDALG
ncbi:MAG: hypothetical protein R3F34_20160 [Planctomycetota bacterium]